MPQAQMQAERIVAITAPRDERMQGRISRDFRFHIQPTFETVRGSAVQMLFTRKRLILARLKNGAADCWC
ncbi:MAG: hypothetical protein V4675_12415, partial [Verrucomicrobiota bacterium]